MDIAHVQLNGETLDVKDEEARKTAITGITLNGDEVSVTANIAGIEFDDVSNGSDGIKTLTVDGDLFDYVNEICDTIGVYFMRATSDTPNIPETAAFFIMLLRNSTAQATMIAFRAGSNTNTYMCKEQASSWGDWTQIIPASGEAPIEHIAVNGEEQPIEDKTVDLAIDRASVDGETLVVGDTAGGGNSQIVTGYDVSVDIPDTEAGFGFFCWDGSIAIASFRDGKVAWHASYNWIDCEMYDGIYRFVTDSAMYYTIIMEG